MRSRWFLFGCLMFSLPLTLAGQDTSTIRFSGYFKSMGMFTENPMNGDRLSTGYLHNRLRFEWNHKSGISFRSDVRNRVFVGGMVSEFPGYASSLDIDVGAVDLTMADQLSNDVVAVSNIDRMVLGYQHQSVSITAGRQRINWGLNNFWNPNDVFNAYDFFDFDYEERPGSDAVRMQYATGNMSFFEGASSVDANGKSRTAMLYRFNRNGYDLQALAGYILGDVVAGFGWAGSIGESGFKGEARWSSSGDVVEQGLVFSVGMDGTFEPGWLVATEFLHNGEAYRKEGVSALSASYPYKNAGLVQITRQFNPVWSMATAALVAEDEIFVLMPSVSCAIADDWEVLITGIGRIVKRETESSFFLRLRWSFSN